MRPVTVTVGPLASAAANNICLSQTPSAGALTLNGSLVSGGVAVLDTPRQVLFTCAGNESANSFTVTGTDWAGMTISETVTGPNASTAATVLSYKTVTSIRIASNAAGALTVGTNGVAYSPWVRLDEWASPVTALQVNVSGTANYTVQASNDDPNSPTNPVTPANMTWVASAAPFASATTSQQGSYSYAPTWLRVLLNSGTGSVTMTVVQSGVAPY